MTAEESWVNQKNSIIEALVAKTASALQFAASGNLDAVDANLHSRALLFQKLETLEAKAELKDLLEGFDKFEGWMKTLESIKSSDRDIAMKISFLFKILGFPHPIRS